MSALDVSDTRRSHRIVLERLQQERGVAYLFITHDLAIARHVSRRIAVMNRGRIVEEGPSDQVCEEPAHPYTQRLVGSTLELDRRLSG